MIDRRSFLGAMVGGLALPARGQLQPPPSRVYRLGILRPTARPRAQTRAAMDDQLPAALARLGYVEGRNLVIDTRYADGRPDRLPGLARELLRHSVDAMIVVTVSAVEAAMAATSTVPIIIWGNFDPVAMKFVASFARPGGNVTGVLIAADGTLGVKKLELLKEAVPRARRIGVLAPQDGNTMRIQLPELERAAPALGVDLAVVTVRDNDYGRAVAALSARKPDALFVAATTFFMTDRAPIIDLTLQHRLPSIWEWREQVEAGGLMAYGTSLVARIDRIADYVDRIFRGSSPAAMPIDQPAQFELALNLTTAKAIGLTLPPAFLLRVDEVIS
jgi:putative ABC transport system substrate-binding protein